MKHISYLIAILLLACTSCQKGFLDKQPDESITIQQAFQKRSYAEAFLTDVYASMGNEYYFTDFQGTSPNPYVIASDEMNIPWPEKFEKLMNKGSWNAYNVDAQLWKNMYEGIRKSNIFLNNIHITPQDAQFSETDRQRWIGECQFLRAYYHFRLVRIYGGVPIMDFASGVADDFTQLRRAPLDTCINFIVRECDEAAARLPMKLTNNRELGRITAAAALALKARMLLYRASPLFNGNPDYTTFADKEGVKLFPQEYRADIWDQAAAAAKAAIDQSEQAGYALYKKHADPVVNYHQLFLDNYNDEVIFAYNAGVSGWMEKCAFPGSLGGWNGYNPTQAQVDAYEMDNGIAPITGYLADGTPIINPASGYQEEGYATADDPNKRWLTGVRNMYVHRDPRFYATINFNGAEFATRRMQFWQTGADGRGNAGRDYNTTGYLLKKYVNPAASITQGRFMLGTYIFFRLGGLYLDYAEALNESQGPTPEVYQYMDAIRTRAGMPKLPAGLDKAGMRARIWRERRVELSYETHRYFDCHRWKIASQTEGGPIYGMNITTGTSLQDNAFYKRTLVETRVFQAPKHYLFPIPQSEIDKAPLLIQNPGW
jgi:hypothetical protein